MTTKIATHKSKRVIERELKDLRELIDADADPLATRIAYAMETAVHWALDHTVGWKGLVYEAKSNAQIFREQTRKETTK